MFSTNPFQQFDSFLNYENDDVCINHHPFVSSDSCFEAFSGSPPTAMEDEFATYKQGSFENYHHQLLDSEVSPTKRKKTPKKDNHSKIHTAQGPRDRRVRLSIEVARKFFSLQDLLGFDKASTTLDWLFNKSKIEIEKLVKGKKHSSSSSTVTEQSDQVDIFETLTDEQDKRQKKKPAEPRGCMEGKKKKMTRKYKSGFPVNQSIARAEARARARERTQEKLRNRMLDDGDTKKALGDDDPCCPPDSLTSLQPSFWSAIESENDYYDERIAELIMAQKISMPSSSMLYCYQHNLTVLSNNSSSTFTGLPDLTVVHEQQDDSGSI